MPIDFVIQEDDGDNVWGPSSQLWATFSLDAKHVGTPAEVACETFQSAADAILGIVMAIGAFTGPEAAPAIEATGSAAEDVVTFGCERVKKAQDLAGEAGRIIRTPTSLSSGQLDDLKSSFQQIQSIGVKGLDEIGKTYDAMVKLFS